MNVPYKIVIEPLELEMYAAVIDRRKIAVLPFDNLGLGSIPARNWVWDNAIESGAKRHWILDDNISHCYRFNHNLRVPVDSGAIFRAAEEFVDRYENIALAGFEYETFVPVKERHLPLRLNTRIYSCILIKNDIPFRWRGRYNEDTDLSLRVLKAGWCTVLFIAFLADKVRTMTMKGGNTDELYQGDGRRRMALSLKNQHPRLVKIKRRWGRWQHVVDYRPFKGNRLIPRDGIEIPAGIDNYSMVLREIEQEARLVE
jgi:hypothetical protein